MVVTNKSNDRALLAFAFLADDLTRGGDLASSILPLFKAVTKQYAGKKFSPKQLSQALSAYYGIDIHPYAVEDLIPRLVAEGILATAPHLVGVEELYYADITEEFESVDESFADNLFSTFRDFSYPMLTANNISLTDTELQNALLARLRKSEFLGILAKPDRTREDQRSVSTLVAKKSSEDDQRDKDITATAHLDVLVASFILHAKETNQQLYELIVKTATGVIVSEVILNFRNPQGINTLQGLTVILDTPFLMSMLDLSSEVRHGYAKRLAAQLSEKGAVLATFRHCIEEFRDNLKAVLTNYERGEAYGETAARLRQLQFRLYAGTLSTSIETRLKELGVVIISDPNAPLHRHFPQADEETLRTKITFHENWLARDRDAHSITDIIRLRAGKAVDFDSFSKCGYIFLTENAKLVRLASDYLVAANVYHERDVPPCLTDRYFAGLLWIMFGGESNLLTEARLIANCVRAVQPRRDVIAKMHRILSGIDSTKEAHFEAIMTSERGAHYFMQQTLGDSVLITEDNAEEVYEQLELIVGERIAREKEAEIEQLKQEAAAEKAAQSKIYEDKLKEKEAALDEQNAMHESQLQTTLANRDRETNELRDHYAASMLQASLAKSDAKNLQKTLEEELTVKRNLEFRVVGSAAKKAVAARKQYKAVVCVVVILVFIALNLADKYILPKLDLNSISEKIGVPLYIAAQTLLFFLSLRFIPEYLFGEAAERKQEATFSKELDEHAIKEWQSRYEVEWKTGDVKHRPPRIHEGQAS
jgi:hypothetical protein